MINTIADPLLEEVAELIAARTGLCFPPERQGDLARGLSAAALEFEFDDLKSCLRWLCSSALTKSQIEILASHLTVGETYFFREKKTLEILQQDILPHLINARRNDRRLRIWSAGCCTGEEAYTIAILLAGMLPDLDRWNVTLLATDINPRFLSKAATGVYSDWSFRDTPEWIRSRYFERKADGRYEVVAQIHKMVTFDYLNLAEDAFPSLTNNTNAMDIIFCRNVLMYLARKHVRTIGRNFFRSLSETGWLIVSPSDTSQELAAQFEAINGCGAILYRKGTPSAERVPTLNWRADDQPDISGASLLAELEVSRDLLPEESHLPFASIRETGAAGTDAVPDEALAFDEACAFYEQGHYTAAEDKLADELARNPEDAQAMSLLARVHANRGNLAEALAWCDQAIIRRKMDPGTHYLRATILQEQGALEEAMRSLKRILYLDPNFALAHFTLGTVALQLQRFEASEKHFENARSLLAAHPQEEVLPESGGITASRLTEIIMRTTTGKALQ